MVWFRKKYEIEMIHVRARTQKHHMKTIRIQIEHVKEPYSSVIDLRSKQGPGTSCYIDPPTCLWAHANCCQVQFISGKTFIEKWLDRITICRNINFILFFYSSNSKIASITKLNPFRIHLIKLQLHQLYTIEYTPSLNNVTYKGEFSWLLHPYTWLNYFDIHYLPFVSGCCAQGYRI